MAVGGSENLGVPVVMWGHNLLVENGHIGARWGFGNEVVLG